MYFVVSDKHRIKCNLQSVNLMDMENEKYFKRINNNMQLNILSKTNSKCAIIEAQHSITNIKNKLKC